MTPSASPGPLSNSKENVEEALNPAKVDRLLREIEHHILQWTDMDTVFTHICRRLAGEFAFDAVRLGVKEPDGSVRIRAQCGPAALSMTELPLRWDSTLAGQGPTGIAIRTGRVQVLTIADLGANRVWSDWLRVSGVQIGVAIPLQASGETVGALSLYSRDPAAFEGPTLGLLTHLAEQLTISILAAMAQEEIQLLRSALEAAANGVVITDRTGRIRWTNPAFTTLTGYDRREVTGATPRILKSGRHGDSFYTAMWQTVLAGGTWRGEIVNRRKDGSEYVEEQTITPVRGTDGAIGYFVAIKQDVTARKEMEEQLRYMAMHDSLTGLPNRRAFMQRLSEWPPGVQGAVILLDLDNFKAVNDSLGHAAGDQVLLQTANLCRTVLEPAQPLFRLGGDEFAVLLTRADLAAAREIAERLRRCISRARVAMPGTQVGISVGLAPIGLPADQALILADLALQQAKTLGKDQIVACANEADVSDAMAEIRMAQAVREAITTGSLVLHFQPVVSTRTGNVEYREALVRMRQNGALVLPGQFLPAAEIYGLMPDIDRWVLGEVRRTLKANPGLRLLVNLSGESLSNEGFRAHVQAELSQDPGAANRITFEVTERSPVTDLPAVTSWMKQMRQIGCGFALDDFGTGYSSLARLRELPVELVKVDGSFVRNIDTDPISRAIVAAVKTAADRMDKQLVAEGVETESVAEVLRELGIELAQGYYWAVPAPLPFE